MSMRPLLACGAALILFAHAVDGNTQDPQRPIWHVMPEKNWWYVFVVVRIAYTFFNWLTICSVRFIRASLTFLFCLFRLLSVSRSRLAACGLVTHVDDGSLLASYRTLLSLSVSLTLLSLSVSSISAFLTVSLLLCLLFSPTLFLHSFLRETHSLGRYLSVCLLSVLRYALSSISASLQQRSERSSFLEWVVPFILSVQPQRPCLG